MRKVSTPWSSVTLPIYGQKAVVQNPNAGSQPIALGISLMGASRFDMESSIRAELENVRTIYLASTSNERIYEDRTWCWFVPQNFVTEDNSSNILKCRLNGVIDERTIHSGNFTTGWTSAGITTATGSPYGKYCLQSPINTTIVYTPPSPLDMSRFNCLNFWLKSTKLSSYLSTCSVALYSGAAYCEWQMTIPQTNKWTYFACPLAQPDAGTTNLSNITALQFNFAPAYPSEYIYCSWIMVD